MGQLERNPLPLMSNSFASRLKAVAQEVEEILDTLLPQPSTRLNKAIRYSTLGAGKRLRSFLCIESCRLFEVDPSVAYPVAAAIEMVQAYSLVHDDLPAMDNADLRRGKASTHKAFNEETAILVGDALIPLAYQTIAALKSSAELKIELIKALSVTIGSEGLVAGQMMDLRQEEALNSFEDLLRVERLKTGVFFAFAAEAGAILGGATSSEREAIKQYGLAFGEAFQMRDDWLDAWGQESNTGKSSHQDAEKLTFLHLLGPEELGKKAESAVNLANESIASFGERAHWLQGAARYILTRER